MTIQVRNYNKGNDFNKISDFLIRSFNDRMNFQNWLQPRWEYMHYHPALYVDSLYNQLDKIRIWEDDDKIVGVINFELSLRDVYLHVAPHYEFLIDEMLKYAEDFKDEENAIVIHINEKNDVFKQAALKNGFKREEKYDEYVAGIQEPVEKPILPTGYQLKGLDEENDLYKINRALYRGFNHEGEPDRDLSGRKLMQSAPNFNEYLNVIAISPSEEYVAYAGMWYDEVNKIGYVEPVATDPDYRKMGLGKACVQESVRRCQALGAKDIYVGSKNPFYYKIGFKHLYIMEGWKKYFV